MAFKLKSGNTTSFKEMGSSPLHQDYHEQHVGRWDADRSLQRSVIDYKKGKRIDQSTNYSTEADMELAQERYDNEVERISHMTEGSKHRLEAEAELGVLDDYISYDTTGTKSSTKTITKDKRKGGQKVVSYSINEGDKKATKTVSHFDEDGNLVKTKEKNVRKKNFWTGKSKTELKKKHQKVFDKDREYESESGFSKGSNISSDENEKLKGVAIEDREGTEIASE